MLETFGVCAVAVLIIGIMLILFLNVVRTNRQIVYSMTNGTAQAAEDKKQSNELKQVYPSYVDCSRDYVQQAYGAADVNALVQKQGA